MAERPEDLNLPSAVVCRIVKDALPPNTKVTKEAQAAIAKVILILCENQSKVIFIANINVIQQKYIDAFYQAASVFVLYATSCSNSIAGKANRKTIQGQDVVAAMEDMEFDKFIKPLETSLQGRLQTPISYAYPYNYS